MCSLWRCGRLVFGVLGRGSTRFGVAVLLAGVLASVPAAAQSGRDYDSDDDGLIEISNLAQLKAVGEDLDGNGLSVDGYDLKHSSLVWVSAFPGAAWRMGCPSGCTGFELTADLDFDTNGDGNVDWRDAFGGNWSPIGRGATESKPARPFAAVFDGNGHAIRNLRIARGGQKYVGLFSVTSADSEIRNLGVVGAAVAGGEFTGAVAGIAYGRLTRVWSTGSVTGSDYVGGVVGQFTGHAAGVWSSSEVTGRNKVGGLFGQVARDTRPRKETSVTAAYATGAVQGASMVGGLVGEAANQSRFTAVYASGSVGPRSGGSVTKAGGLVGHTESAAPNLGTEQRRVNYLYLRRSIFTGAYWDTGTTGQATSAPGRLANESAVGKTTVQLKNPVGYTGIYSGWDLDLDGDGAVDDPWDFGTNIQYPALRGNLDGDGRASAYEFGGQGRPKPPANLDPAFAGPTANASATENQTSVTGSPTATDPDGDSLTYQINTSSGDHASFNIVPSTGVLSFKSAPDYESKSSYSVTVQVRDSKDDAGDGDGAWDDSVTVTVTVGDANEAPAFTAGAAPTAAENQTSVTGSPTATDPDGDSLTYGIDAAAGDGASFDIAPSTGVLSFKSAPDYESKSSYSVTVQVRDSKNPAGGVDSVWDDTETVTVNVTNANEAPAFTAGAAPTAAENQTSVTGSPTATDPDGDSLTYGIDTAAGDGASFDIAPSTGVLSFKSAPNYESKSSYSVTVQVRDSKNPAGGVDSVWDDTETVTVNVTNANEAPAFTAGAAPTAAENQTSVSGSPTATDPDGDSLTYGIDAAAGDGASFDIAPSTGVLSFKSAPNYESKSSYSVTVQVRDSKNPAGGVDSVWDATVTVTVTVTDVDEAPAAPTGLSVVPGVGSLRVSWTAPTVSGAPAVSSYEVQYALRTSASGPVWDDWVDWPHGDLTTNAEITSLVAGSTYRVQVRAVNEEGNSGWAGPEEGVPTVASASNADPEFDDGASASFDVEENTTAVGTVHASDANAADTLVYALAPSSDYALFGIDNTTGALRFSAPPDYEAVGAGKSYSVRVTVSDGEGGTDSIDVTVNVTDADEPPAPPTALNVAAAANALEVSWTAPTASAMAGKPAVSGYEVQYSLRTAAGPPPQWGDWEDAGHTGTAATFTIGSLVAGSTYRVQVRANSPEGDSGWAGPEEGVPTVASASNADPEFDDGASASFDVEENTTAVGTVHASDANAADTLVYALAPSSDYALFGIDNTTGALRFSAPPDYEAVGAGKSYSVRVTVSDGEGGTDSIDVTVNVTDADEPPAPPTALNVAAAANALEVSWTAPTASAMAGKPAVSGYEVQYSLRTAAGPPPQWGDWEDAGHTGTAATFTIGSLVAGSTYRVQVRANSPEGNSGWLGPQSDVPSAPAPGNADPEFDDGASASFDVEENTTAVGTVHASDANAADTLVYALAPSSDYALFGIDNTTGALRFSAPPDYEAVGAGKSYSVRVTVSDGEGGTDSIDVTVNVTDADEPPAPPTALNVAAAANALEVSWTAPTASAMAGKPAVSGYEVQYSLRTAAGPPPQWGDWEDAGHTGTAATFTIGSLVAGSTYRVQVRANSPEGNSGWLGPQSDVPSAPAPGNADPVFSDGASAARRVAENSAPATAVGAPVGATDGDDDTLVYALAASGDHAHFDIVSASGQIKTKGALDYESKRSYSVTVTVSDGKGGADTIGVTITVTDVSEARPRPRPQRADPDPDPEPVTGAADDTAKFTDIDGSVHRDNVEAIARAGITLGCNPPANDRYCPQRAVTRAQMASFLSRALKLPAAKKNYFTDTAGSVHRDNINRLAQAGITVGCGAAADDRYCPQRAVTRAEMASFLSRAIRLPAARKNYFTDTAGSVHRSHINRIARAGITVGCNPAGDRYCPQRAVTRAQMASFLSRALKLTDTTP